MSVTIDTTEVDSLLATLREQILSEEMTLNQLRWYSNLTKEVRNKMMETKNEVVDKPVQVSTSILRTISEPLTLAATDGTEIIPNAKDLFTGWLDSDFRNWGADEASPPTPDTPVSVYEMVQDATFAQMFGSLNAQKEKLCMTQSQIIGFVKTHRQHLRTDGYATFFLFQSKGKFFVARVDFDGGGCLRVGVYRFGDDYVWSSGYRHRVVVPQL